MILQVIAGLRGVECFLALIGTDDGDHRKLTHQPQSDVSGVDVDDDESLFNLSCDSVSLARVGSSSSPYAVADLLGTSLRNLEIENAAVRSRKKSQNLYQESDQQQQPPPQQQPQEQRRSGSIPTPPYVNVESDSAMERGPGGATTLNQSRTSLASSSSSTVSGERMAVNDDGSLYLKSSLC